MLMITGNQIYLTRGDTMFVSLSLVNQDGTAYTPNEDDAIYFRLKKFATYPNLLIEKQIDISSMVLQLNNSDTQNLPFGDYRYEIEVITADNYHFTAIADELFTSGNMKKRSQINWTWSSWVDL